MDLKSYEEFIIGVYKAMLVDMSLQYPTLTKEFNRDCIRLSSAIEHHGIHFFLDTMPSYRKHFDKCLDTKRLTSSHLFHFGAYKKGGVIPRLFRGLILRVFDVTGNLVDKPDVEAIRLIRQLLGAVKKMRMESSVKDRASEIDDFYRLDMGVRSGSLFWSDPSLSVECLDQTSSFTELARIEDASQGRLAIDESPIPPPPYGLLEIVQQVADLCSSQLGSFNPMEWKPRHGPGAVSDQRFGSYKYDFKTWPERLESVFPQADFAFANYACAADALIYGGNAEFSSHEFPARLCAVPKTLRKPRLIASEPTHLQWCQQVIRDYFYRRTSETLLSSFINFRRQDLNAELALRASQDASHATIDLSSASDRISCWHVERLFRRLPCLLDALRSSRSVYLKQTICSSAPAYHRIRKYSTMGNATTFPVQTVFFTVLAVSSVLYARKRRVNFKNLCMVAKEQVRVFGDDIIVPNDCAGVLTDLIHSLSLKVNHAKSFTEGNFRESCGMDAFLGHDVTSVSIMDVPDRARPGSIVSSVDVHNNLISRGFMHAAAFIRKTAKPHTRDKVRVVKHGSGLFGWSDLCGIEAPVLRTRFSKTLHRLEQYCLKLKTSEQRLPPQDSAGLLQYFIEAPAVVTSVTSTLGYPTRRPKVGLTLGWVPVA